MEIGYRGRAHTVATRLAAGATLGLALWAAATFPGGHDLTLSGGWSSPIIALELARTEADLDFLRAASPAVLDMLDAGHRIDTVFPVAYGALLALSAWTLRGRLAVVGVLLALLAIPCDLWENHTLVAITDAIRRGQPCEPWLDTLRLATWSKWGAIAASLATLAAGLARAERLTALVAGCAAVLTLIAGLTSSPTLGEAMSGAAALAFLVLGAWAFRLPG